MDLSSYRWPTLFSLLLSLVPAVLAADTDPRPYQTAAVLGETGADGLPPTLRQSMERLDEPALSIHEPMYFIVGGRDGDDLRARFQLSFKYRLFDAEGPVVRALPWAAGLHFAYTQTALWNLSKESAPFEDSSYRPSLFWQFDRLLGQSRAGILALGIEHESNGQAGEQSRSIDTLFIAPGLIGSLWGRELLFIPKLYAYVNKGSENRDIHRYRGHGDFILRYGNDDSWVVHVLYRRGSIGVDTTQVDLSVPLRPRIFARTGAYVYIQAFEGYGESLLGHARRTGPNLRVGLAVVR